MDKEKIVPQWMGNLPFDKNNKEPLKIAAEEKGMNEIYGEGNNRICCHTYISTDDVLISHWKVPSGQSFQPPDIHSGDELYYILDGEAHIFNAETGQLVLAEEGSLVFVPRKSWHQVYNFSDSDVTLIAIITGKIWEEEDMEMVEDRNFNSIFFNNINKIEED